MPLPAINRDRRADLTLRAELADTEQRIATLDTHNELSAGEKLKWKAYYEDERERLQLKLQLPGLRSALTFAKAEYEFACSPAGKKKAHRQAQMILAGRILGAGQGRMVWNDIPEDTHEKQAKAKLDAAQHALESAEKRIRYLLRRNSRLKRKMINMQPVAESRCKIHSP